MLEVLYPGLCLIISCKSPLRHRLLRVLGVVWWGSASLLLHFQYSPMSSSETPFFYELGAEKGKYYALILKPKSTVLWLLKNF